MSERIIDLIQANKEVEGQPLPIEKSALVESIGTIDNEILTEYIKFMLSYLEEFAELINVFTAAKHPKACAQLIGLLNQQQLKYLSDLVNSINSPQVLELGSKIRQLTEDYPLIKMKEQYGIE